MPSLKEIRTRIHSVDNIQKITNTMEMVAAAQLRKAQQKAEQSRPYAYKLKQILDHVSSSDISHPLLEKRAATNKTGLIIVGSDRGLCGSYNTNIFSKADKFLKQFAKDKGKIELIPVGRKVVEHYQRDKWTIRHSITGWERLSYHDVRLLANQLISWYLEEHFDEVWLIYTHYINVISRQVILEKFLPFEETVPKVVTRERSRLDYIFEPSAAEIYEDILPRYFITKIQTVLHEAYASELGARIFSMKAASTNAIEMIEKLTLERNKVRQASITREIAEITSGAENLN